MVDNPYEAPRAPGAPPPTLDGRRAAGAFVLWLLGASLVAGVSTALQTGHALRAFGAESHIWRILPLAAFRVRAAHVAVSAASVSLVVATHPAPRARGGPRRALPPWLLYAAVPLATPIAACTMILAGIGAATLAYDVAPGASWQGILETTRFGDPLYGVACACAYALVLGAIVAVGGPRLTIVRWGLAAKIVVALLATGLITGIVGGVVDAAVSLREDPGAD